MAAPPTRHKMIDGFYLDAKLLIELLRVSLVELVLKFDRKRSTASGRDHQDVVPDLLPRRQHHLVAKAMFTASN